MNTKKLEEINKKIDSILETETPESLLNWLEEKRKGTITPSPERGKEGKTAEEILSPKRGKGNFIHCVDYEDALEAMEEYAQSTSKMPVEPKTSVGDEYCKALEDYNKLLSEELNDVVGMAAIHGWKSDRVDQGQRMRERIAELRKGLSMQQGRGDEWISVEEGLPITEIDKAEQVIVLSDKKDGSKPLVICAVFWNGNFYLQESWGHKETKSPLLKYTTHWQPLPPFTQSRGTE